MLIERQIERADHGLQRVVELVKDGTMYVQAGAGIVADSDPESEFEECRQKARALVRAAEEAVRFAAGKGGPNNAG